MDSWMRTFLLKRVRKDKEKKKKENVGIHIFQNNINKYLTYQEKIV